MGASTFTLVPDLASCEFKVIAEAFWQLFRGCAADPGQRDCFRIVAPESGRPEISERGFILPLSGGYVLVFDPEKGALESSEAGRGFSIMSVGANEMTLIQLPEPKAAPAMLRKTVVLADPAHIFAPLWDVKANQLFCYLTRLEWNLPDGGRISEQTVDAHGVSLDRLLAVDLEAAERTVETVQQTAGAFGAGVFSIPVHPRVLATAANRWGSEIWPLVLPVFDQIVFEIVPGFDAPSAEHVEAAVRALEDFGRPILLRTDLSENALQWASQLPISAVGFDGGSHAQVHAKDPNFKAFGAVTQIGKPAYVLGLTSVAPTIAAINAGFAYVGSDVISPPSLSGGSDGLSDDPAELLKTVLTQRSLAQRM